MTRSVRILRSRRRSNSSLDGKKDCFAQSFFLFLYQAAFAYGVVIHICNAALGFLILLLPWCSAPAIGMPIALVNLILSLLPVAILRFNTAPLRNLHLRSINKA